MKTFYYEDYENLIDEIVDRFSDLDEFKSVDIIAKYDEAKEIIKELICFGYDICSINIEEPEYSCYNDEYIVTLSDFGIFCKKFKRENGYISIDDNIVFVSNDCNSKCLKNIHSNEIYAFEIVDEVTFLEDGEIDFFGFDNCYECRCCECEHEHDYDDEEVHSSISDIIHRDEDTGAVNGFTKTWSDYADSHYNSHTYSYFDDDVSQLRKIARIFDIEL